MSDVPPSQSMFVPDRNPSNPELHYDGVGNAYVHDHLGNWLSHPGIAHAATCAEWPQAHPYGQHATTPVMYGLTSPADFSQPREASEPPPLPSGSRPVLGSTQNPAHIQLPNSPDRDLHDPIAISEARGYAPIVRTAGTHCKTAAKTNKSKGKEKDNTGHATQQYFISPLDFNAGNYSSYK
ncbi:hypothetical protein EV702DRAFT_1042415 [Suillus placidus]|uniref:Uncharacterized protein n=1 Tax=Suillus placidus TaxID=48579 RepID=A0A9P7A3Y3_9AGAM|nr:hypothetical protein EV702DRAFT_1042415 [Suillus placidus]